MSDVLELKLRKPIVMDDRTYEQLDLAEPTAGQLRDVAPLTNQHAQNIKLISLVGNVPVAVVEKLPATEYLTAHEWLQGKLNASPTTGEK